MTDKIIVLTTCPDRPNANQIAQSLLEKRLAACVNILPGIESMYRWKGAIETATELLLLIKTRQDLLPAVQSEITRLHSYEVPELIALPVSGGGTAYLEWLTKELSPDE